MLLYIVLLSVVICVAIQTFLSQIIIPILPQTYEKTNKKTRSLIYFQLQRDLLKHFMLFCLDQDSLFESISNNKNVM